MHVVTSIYFDQHRYVHVCSISFDAYMQNYVCMVTIEVYDHMQYSLVDPVPFKILAMTIKQGLLTLFSC